MHESHRPEIAAGDHSDPTPQRDAGQETEWASRPAASTLDSRDRLGRRLSVSVLLLALLLGLDAAGYGLSEGLGRPLSSEERRDEMRQNLLWAGRAIRAHEAQTGQLPSSPRDVGLLPEYGWAYERTSARHFTLSLSWQGTVSTYDSTRDEISFSEAPRSADARSAEGAAGARREGQRTP